MGKYREKGTQVSDYNSGLTQEFWVFGVLEKGTLLSNSELTIHEGSVYRDDGRWGKGSLGRKYVSGNGRQEQGVLIISKFLGLEGQPLLAGTLKLSDICDDSSPCWAAWGHGHFPVCLSCHLQCSHSAWIMVDNKYWMSKWRRGLLDGFHFHDSLALHILSRDLRRAHAAVPSDKGITTCHTMI